MAKGAKLKDALNRHKGVDHKLEHQKKLQKSAEKRKRKQQEPDFDALEKAIAAAEAQDKAGQNGDDAKSSAATFVQLTESANGQEDGWESDVSSEADEENEGVLLDDEEEDDEDDEEEDIDDVDGGIEIGQMEDESDSDSEDEQLNRNGIDGDESDEEDIPLSDIESLASDERGDIIPHQRLTINNTAALQRSLKSFALPASLPFSAVQAVTSAEPVEIADVEDDLTRETAFYQQSLNAVKEARVRLKSEGVPFTRPTDYFAEMVKSEEQMGKVRAKMVDEAARKKASSDARRQRDLKKFGKAVQVAKLQERDKAKRDTLDKINALKRKRAGNTEMDANEGDMFDVALEDAADTEKRDRAARRAGGPAGAPNRKRQKKDEKFGFGGKKRFAKSNDAKSTNDMRGFSGKKMKGKSQRPGKSRRAAGRG